MSRFKKEVAAVIANQDVRDPRAALLAIEKLLTAKVAGPKKLKVYVKLLGEVLCINVFKRDDGKFAATVFSEEFTGEIGFVVDLGRAINAVLAAREEIANQTLNKIIAQEKQDV